MTGAILLRTDGTPVTRHSQGACLLAKKVRKALWAIACNIVSQLWLTLPRDIGVCADWVRQRAGRGGLHACVSAVP